MEVLARESAHEASVCMQPPNESDTELRVGGEYQSIEFAASGTN